MKIKFYIAFFLLAITFFITACQPTIPNNSSWVNPNSSYPNLKLFFKIGDNKLIVYHYLDDNQNCDVKINSYHEFKILQKTKNILKIEGVFHRDTYLIFHKNLIKYCEDSLFSKECDTLFRVENTGNIQELVKGTTQNLSYYFAEKIEFQEQQIKEYSEDIFVGEYAQTLIQDLEKLKTQILLDQFDVEYNSKLCWKRLKELNRIVGHRNPFNGNYIGNYAFLVKKINSDYNHYTNTDSLYCSNQKGIVLEHINPTFSDSLYGLFKIPIGEIIVYCNDLMLEIYRLNF